MQPPGQRAPSGQLMQPARPAYAVHLNARPNKTPNTCLSTGLNTRLTTCLNARLSACLERRMDS